jgi:hypothetical protein
MKADANRSARIALLDVSRGEVLAQLAAPFEPQRAAVVAGDGAYAESTQRSSCDVSGHW